MPFRRRYYCYDGAVEVLVALESVSLSLRMSTLDPDVAFGVNEQRRPDQPVEVVDEIVA